MTPHKILMIRLSSIGDIVLTTPVIRCLKKQLPHVEIHYLTKFANKSVVENNPYISRVYLLKDSLDETIRDLKKENYDYIVDLHKNLRSFRIKMALQKRYGTFSKLNVRKWWYVKTKKTSLMPPIHIVDRYFEAVKSLSVTNDMEGLDFFEKNEDIMTPNGDYMVIVCGAKHATKQIPISKIAFLTEQIQGNILLLGDAWDRERIQDSEIAFGAHVYNLCGETTLNQSALYVKNAKLIITPDTGFMHIAAAYRKKMFVIWGNTTPQLGMYPYMPNCEEKLYENVEVRDLSCRPCSKLGYTSCPKGHFNCMNAIDWEQLAIQIVKAFNQ